MCVCNVREKKQECSEYEHIYIYKGVDSRLKVRPIPLSTMRRHFSKQLVIVVAV